MSDRWDIACVQCDDAAGTAFGGDGLHVYEELAFLVNVSVRRRIARACVELVQVEQSSEGVSRMYRRLSPRLCFEDLRHIGRLDIHWWATHGDHELVFGPWYELDSIRQGARDKGPTSAGSAERDASPPGESVAGPAPGDGSAPVPRPSLLELCIRFARALGNTRENDLALVALVREVVERAPLDNLEPILTRLIETTRKRFVLEHPSERVLCHSGDGAAVWAFEGVPPLFVPMTFETRVEAEKHRDSSAALEGSRIIEWPR